MFPVLITPHTWKLIQGAGSKDPIVRLCLPSAQELVIKEGEQSDPLGEQSCIPVPGLLHRYEDRALLLATSACAQHCRFCFRRCLKSVMPSSPDSSLVRQYLFVHPEIEEVILSGGDPLLLTDDLLFLWFQTVSDIPTVKRFRIHTRVPVVLPSRITSSFLHLCGRMQATHALTLVTHFNHPKELARENRLVLEQLKSIGMTLKNQSVLLRDVNDDPAILAELFWSLSNLKVENYYLHQLDPACGTRHFYVSVQKGKDIMRQIRLSHPHLSLPRYVADIPSMGGKKDLEQEDIVERSPGLYGKA